MPKRKIDAAQFGSGASTLLSPSTAKAGPSRSSTHQAPDDGFAPVLKRARNRGGSSGSTSQRGPTPVMPERAFSISSGISQTLGVSLAPVLAIEPEAQQEIHESAFARSLAPDASEDIPGPGIHSAELPTSTQKWTDDTVRRTWQLAVAKQESIKDLLKTSRPTLAERARLQRCVQVDLSDLSKVAPGTQLALEPHTQIVEKFRAFHIACQATRVPLRAGGYIKSKANVMLPVLLRHITETDDDPAFTRTAQIEGQHPTEFLGDLARFTAPGNPDLADVLNCIMQEMPHARSQLGACKLVDMAQNIDVNLVTGGLWGTSVAIAYGLGELANTQERLIKKDFDLSQDDLPVTAGQVTALAISDASTSGDAEGLDGLLIENMGNVAEREPISLGLKTWGNAAKSYGVGFVTTLPAGLLTYTDVGTAGHIAGSIFANGIAAVGGVYPLSVQLQGRKDNNVGGTIAMIDQNLLAPMGKQEIIALADNAERISTLGQNMQKGHTTAAISGAITGAMQGSGEVSANIQRKAQRILLNPVEAHQMLFGGLLAKWAKSGKSDNLFGVVLENLLNERPTTMEQVIAVHETKIEGEYQAVGRNIAAGMNGAVNSAENGVRSLAGIATRGRVKAHPRYRFDFDGVAPRRGSGGDGQGFALQVTGPANTEIDVEGSSEERGAPADPDAIELGPIRRA